MKYFQCALNALWVFTAASKENCDIGDMKTLTVCSILDFFFPDEDQQFKLFFISKDFKPCFYKFKICSAPFHAFLKISTDENFCLIRIYK